MKRIFRFIVFVQLTSFLFGQCAQKGVITEAEAAGLISDLQTPVSGNQAATISQVPDSGKETSSVSNPPAVQVNQVTGSGSKSSPPL